MMMPPKMNGPDGQLPNSCPQNIPSMNLGMVGQFPPMASMPQGPQMPGSPGGMPMGYMMVGPEQFRQMSQNQALLQQLQLAKNGMMGGGMQIPKGDGNNNEQNKK
jgi:hypothetical protein